MSKYSTIGTITGDTGRHASIFAGMSETSWPQITVGRLSAEAGTTDNQIPIVAQGFAKVRTGADADHLI